MMPSYTIKFFDHGHNIYAAKYVDCANDDQAVTAAHRLNVASIGAGFEVWQDDRFILQIWNGLSGPAVTVRAAGPLPAGRPPSIPESGGHA